VSDESAFAELIARAYARDPLYTNIVQKTTKVEDVIKAIFKVSRICVWCVINKILILS
jgi:hypothetical protein